MIILESSYKIGQESEELRIEEGVFILQKEYIGCEEYCALNKGKKVFLEDAVKEYLVQVENEKMNLENLTKKYGELVDTSLRAEVIVTEDIERTKGNIREITEIYNFLIEEDETSSWRASLPLEREFIDINKLCFEK